MSGAGAKQLAGGVRSAVAAPLSVAGGARLTATAPVFTFVGSSGASAHCPGDKRPREHAEGPGDEYVPLRKKEKAAPRHVDRNLLLRANKASQLAPLANKSSALAPYKPYFGRCA